MKFVWPAIFHRLSVWNCMISALGLWRSTRAQYLGLKGAIWCSDEDWLRIGFFRRCWYFKNDVWTLFEREKLGRDMQLSYYQIELWTCNKVKLRSWIIGSVESSINSLRILKDSSEECSYFLLNNSLCLRELISYLHTFRGYSRGCYCLIERGAINSNIFFSLKKYRSIFSSFWNIWNSDLYSVNFTCTCMHEL